MPTPLPTMAELLNFFMVVAFVLGLLACIVSAYVVYNRKKPKVYCTKPQESHSKARAGHQRHEERAWYDQHR